MAVCVLDGRTRLVAAGGQTVFTIGWDATLVNDADVLCWFEDVSAGTPGAELVQGAGAGKFTVDRTAGEITLGTAAEVNDIITIERHQSSPTRLTTFTNPGDFIPSVVNNEFDHFLQLLEDLGRDRCRSIRMDRGVDLTSLDLELPAPVENRAIGWTDATTLGNMETLGATTVSTNVLVLTSDGIAALPSLAWNTATDTGAHTGWYLSANDQISMTLGGTAVIDYKATQTHFFQDVRTTGQFIAGSGVETLTSGAGKLLLAAIEAGGAAVGEHLEWNGSTWTPSAAGVVGGSGTLDTIPLWTPDGVTLGDSALTQVAGNVTASGNLLSFGAAAGVQGNEAAGDVILTCTNSDATDPGSDALLWIQAEDTGGDPYVKWTGGAPVSYTLGIDNSDSDKFVGSVGAALGTANWLEVTIAGNTLLTGTISAGSGSTLLTTIAGLLRHQAIDPAIAGSGITNTSGVLSVTSGLAGSGTLNAIPLWTPDGSTLGDSSLSESGGTIVASTVLLSVTLSSAGSTVEATVANTDNTNPGSSAKLSMQVAGTSAGDPLTHWNIVGTQNYVLGIDNSDSDKFVGSVGAALGTTNWLEVTTARSIVLDAAAAQTISLQVDSTEEVSVSGTAVTIASNDLTLTLGDHVVSAGDASFGRGLVAGVRVAIGENNTQTTDMLRLVQNGDGDAAIGFVAVGGTGTDWIMGTDGTDGSFALGLGVAGVDAFPALVVDASRNIVVSVGDLDVLSGNASINGILTLPKASGNGIKVDIASPTFGFADIIGDQFSKNTGATQPTLAVYNGAINAWQFAAADEAFMSFHIPHDYVAGTDIFLHIHWSHTGTLVDGGTVTFKATSIYAKGHNQTFFGTPAVGTFVGTASTAQYQHVLTEVQYSDPTPTGLELDTDLLEPDGVIEMTFEVDANDITVSGGGIPDPFIHFVDVHYQSTGLIGTKAKAPDFYA